MQITSPLPLDAVLKEIQRRWGFRALRKAGDDYSTPLATLSTGAPSLDALLRSGFPRGHIIELLGMGTSGLHTLALRAIAQAQIKGESAVYVDLDNTFDPAYAAHCGIDVSKLLLVRPRVPAQGLEVAANAIYHGAGVLVWDSTTSFLASKEGAWRLGQALHQMETLLTCSTCSVIFLTRVTSRLYQEGAPPLHHHTALRLRLQTTGWEQHHDLITGYEVGVQVLRNRFGPEGGRGSFTVRL